MGRKIAIIGMANTTRDLAPYDDPSWEIWGMNESYAKKNRVRGSKTDRYLKRWDRIFQIHQRWDFLRDNNFNHSNHAAWLFDEVIECKECNGHGIKGSKTCWDCEGSGQYDPKTDYRDGDFPIYMQEVHDDIRNSVKFPLEDILLDYKDLIDDDKIEYFTSSFPLAIALALYEHRDAKLSNAMTYSDGEDAIRAGYVEEVSEIGLWGIEMHSGEEYSFQKPCAEFWLGVALGSGVKLTLPDGCYLLGQTEQLYAYEREAGTFSKMHSEIRLRALEKTFLLAQAKVNNIKGEKSHVANIYNNEKGQSVGRRQKLEKQLAQLMEDEINQLLAMNAAYAALQEQQFVNAELKSQRTSGEIYIVDRMNKQKSIGVME